MPIQSSSRYRRTALVPLLFSLLLSVSLSSCTSRPDSKQAPAAAATPPANEAPGVALRPTCALPKTAKSFQLSTPAASVGDTVNVSFEDIRQTINASCKSCHLAPGSNTGGFSYQD
ncbi:MAG: hypothetical protein EOP07_24875, partial [Proteobacteria bacterium]